MRSLTAIVLSVLLTGVAAADDEFNYGEKPPPKTVLAMAGCPDDAWPYSTRRPFDGGFVFAVRCPGNVASYVEALVWVSDKNGKGARLLLTTEVFDVADGTLPGAVVAASTCSDSSDWSSTRRAFAGGVIFTVKCPGNNANYIEELIWARDADGKDARVLAFPSPDKRYGGEPATGLSNIRWHAEAMEVKEIAVDQEQDICRSEGIWRLEGVLPEAKNVYWRETRDCDGKEGWKVLVDERNRANPK